MRSWSVMNLLVLVAVAAGCRAPQGNTVQEKRADSLRMRDQVLAELFRSQPETRSHIENAPGYAVFSNVGSKILVLATGNGFGVVVDNDTGDTTYMKMIEAGGGLGFGIKDYRAVYVFNDRLALLRFLGENWQAGAAADVALKHGTQGGDASVEVNTDQLMSPITVYQFTESGISLSAVATGARFYPDDALN